MSGVVLSGDSSGAITLNAPAVAGTNTQTLVPATGDLAPIIRGTAVTASGTAVDFTGIPSWVKRITVMFNGVSTNGTSNVVVQLGTSSGFVTTGYLTFSTRLGASSLSSAFPTAGVAAVNLAVATDTFGGSITISNLNGNNWVSQGAAYVNTISGCTTAGSITLAGVLDRIRITTVNGTDTFDAGTINIMYE